MVAKAPANLIEAIVDATVHYDESRCVALAQQAIDEGLDPFKVIQEGFSRGMQIVGDKFSTLEYCLPEVMMAADAMNAATEILKPRLLKSHEGDSQGIIVLGVMQGMNLISLTWVPVAFTQSVIPIGSILFLIGQALSLPEYWSKTMKGISLEHAEIEEEVETELQKNKDRV